MNPEITKIIEQYLAGELSAADQISFEERLKEHTELREEVEKQRSIHEAAKRAHQRQQVKNTGKKYHMKRNFLRGGLSLVIAGIIAVGTILLINALDEKIPELTDEVRAKLDKMAPYELDAQYFLIPEDGGVVLSEKGVLISVPKGAFMHNGKPFEGEVAVQFQEALDASDVVISGLSTMSGDQLLETGGMVSVAGYTLEGEALDFNPKVGVYVQVPSTNDNPDMKLYDGKMKADGTIDWVDPVELEKIPVPAAMSQLDFYPAGYEAHLNKLKWKQNKASRDSLYLSFEESYTSNHAIEEKEGAFSKVDKSSSKGNWSERDLNLAIKEVNKIKADLEIVLGAQANDYISCYLNKVEAAYENFYNANSDQEGCDLLAKNCLDEIVGTSISPTPSPRIPMRKLTSVERDYIYSDNRPIDQNMSEEEAFRLASWLENPNYSDFENLRNHPKIMQYYPYENEIFVSIDSTDAIAYEDAAACSYILPSKVLGFWKKQFNNTNLATRDFERRMQLIHKTCDNTVLDIYVENLDKPLYKCDEMVVALGHTDFQSFASERVGKINASNKHLSNLSKFYNTSVKQLSNRNKTLQKKEQKRRDGHDRKVEKSRSDEIKRRNWREQQAYREEFNYNLENVYKQLGKTHSFTIRSASSGFQGRTAVKNIDALVAEATMNRTSTTITDPDTGKKAQLTYNDFEFKVANSSEYIKLYAYVMPYEINSYTRVDPKNGTFNYPLNNDMRYNLAVIGVKKDGYGYFQKQNFRKDDLDLVTLGHVSEVKLKASVEQLNKGRNSEPLRITEELDWMVTEQANYKEQKMREDMDQFRSKVRSIIFPCCNECVEETYDSIEQQSLMDIDYMQ